MLPSPADGTSFVRRLRVRSPRGLDPTLARLRVERVLGGASLRPPGSAPSAVLCVRELRDPRPRRLRLDPGHPGAPLEWERAVASALDELARDAARPAEGPVPPSARAVLFEDRAQLLACLAAAWCDGTLPVGWWWRALFGPDPAATLVPAWIGSPEYVPAALGELARRGQALTFVSSLAPADARRILDAVIAAHALRDLRASLEGIPTGGADGQDGAGSAAVSLAHPPGDGEAVRSLSASPPGAQPRPQRDPQQSAPGTPWQLWAPEAGAHGAGLDASLLLGVGLVLHRAPRVARSPEFARAVLAWRSETVQGRGGEHKPPPPAPVPRPEGADGVPQEMSSGVSEHRPPASAGDAPTSAVSLSGRPPDAAPDTLSALSSRPGVRTESAQEHDGDVSDVWSLSERIDRYPDGEGMPPQQGVGLELPSAVSLEPHVERESVETELGGLFYLVNLGLFLGLYGDFTAPLRPGIALDVWDFVALLGEGLLGPEVAADPVWPLLARLAHRAPHEEPGAGFEPPEDWRLPPDWLDPFPHGPAWTWSARQGRLRVRHPEGFLVLDVPRDGRAASQQAAIETVPYARNQAPQLRRAALPRRGRYLTALGLWLDRLLPYVRARLHSALGPEGGQDAALLCRRRARVRVSSSRVDVHLSLAELPIEVRLSGLDRDPGWVPAAGRFVAFHFE